MRQVGILTLAGLLVSASAANIAVEPVSRMQIQWWKQRFTEKQHELETHSAGLIWIGDSITQNWELNGPEPWLRFTPIWNRYYGRFGAINLGFKGDSTCHVLWRLINGELRTTEPKVAVLLIGANNFGHIHTSAEETFAGIKAILSLMHRRWSRTRVIVIGVLPSIRSDWVDTNTRLLNADLSTLASELNYVDFVNARSIFLKDGRVDASQFIDPRLNPPQPALHPTAEAQQEIAAMIAPLVEQDFRLSGDR